MRSKWLTGVVLAGFIATCSTTASAADYGGGSFKDTYVTPAPTFNWTGVYLGLQGGYTWGKSPRVPWGFIPGPLDRDDGPVNLNGAVLGIVGGYNFQAGSWVFGAEGDFEKSWLDGNDRGRGGDVNGLEADWMASLRGRVGYLVTPNSLFYVTGGGAWLNAEGVVLDEPNSSPRKTFTGWTLGAGLEYMFAQQATLRLEYRYTDFDRAVGRYANPVGPGPYNLGFEPEIHAVRAGVTFLLQ